MHRSVIPFFFMLILSVHGYGQKTETVFDQFDKVNAQVERWNTAINENNLEELMLLYADTVDYYVNRSSKEEVVHGKNKWLNEHTGYKQRMKYYEVYYTQDMDDENPKVITARFTKVCFEKGDSTEVTSYLLFSRYNGEWKIWKESDLGSEVVKAKSKPLCTLKKGSYSFYFGYMWDFREMEDFAHDSAPYNFNLTLEIGDKITGDYQLFSGGLGEGINFLIPEGNIKNGILEIVTIWNGNWEYSLEDYYNHTIPKTAIQKWKFKIISDTELICLNGDGYTDGQSFKLVK